MFGTISESEMRRRTENVGATILTVLLGLVIMVALQLFDAPSQIMPLTSPIILLIAIEMVS